MFVGQTSDGWLLKIDTVTGKQIARYETVRKVDCPTCTASRTAWYPSRVVVDLEGDVYVANRAFGSQGSISKIAGARAAAPTATRTAPSTPRTTPTTTASSTSTAPPSSRARTTSACSTPRRRRQRHLPARPHPRRQGQRLCRHLPGQEGLQARHHPDPAVVTKSFNLPSTPYGFVVRGDYLYASALGEAVMRVDLLTDVVKTMNAPGNYGIAVDQNGIGWFGGSGLQRCDFEKGGNCEAKGGNS
jgi:hypothetical protein